MLRCYALFYDFERLDRRTENLKKKCKLGRDAKHGSQGNEAVGGSERETERDRAERLLQPISDTEQRRFQFVLTG